MCCLIVMLLQKLLSARMLINVSFFMCVFQYMTAAAAAAPMQGTYIPQYTPVPPTAVPVEVRATNLAIKKIISLCLPKGGHH